QGNIIRSPSDKRLKEDINPIENPIEKIEKIKGVKYEWKNEDRFGSGKEVGLIAQNVKEVIPEAVQSGGEYMSLNYGNLTAVLIEAMQEQQQQIDGLSTGNAIQGNPSGNVSSGELEVSTSSDYKNVKLEGHTTFSRDSVGQAVVKRGYKKVTVKFKNKYQSQPIVTANQVGKVKENLDYSVKDISTAKFDIVLDDRYERDIKFNWHSFAAGSNSKIFFSDGDTKDIEVNVEEIKGCTKPEAENYDPNATKNDGSCKILGCVDIKADNYDPDATISDGSCTYTDSGDSSSSDSATNSSEPQKDSSSTSTTENVSSTDKLDSGSGSTSSSTAGTSTSSLKEDKTTKEDEATSATTSEKSITTTTTDKKSTNDQLDQNSTSTQKTKNENVSTSDKNDNEENTSSNTSTQKTNTQEKSSSNSESNSTADSDKKNNGSKNKDSNDSTSKQETQNTSENKKDSNDEENVSNLTEEGTDTNIDNTNDKKNTDSSTSTTKNNS
ncbi:MAG: tail fiber domain-containing protein, partial [Candidatus Magasanikbacteria bacterium]